LKRVSPLLILLLLAIAGPLGVGCGSDDSPDPESVVESTLGPGSPGADGGGTARITVESLGFEDSVLDSRTVPVPADAYAAIRRALADRGRAGLASLFRDLSSEGSAEVEGVESDHVSGSIDVGQLVRRLSRFDRSGAGADAAAAGAVPALDDLERLEQTVTEAGFDLFSSTGDHRLVRLDLTLAIDDPDNALPPTRIRFSLTGAD
jgi:hypothetical protein